MLPHTWSQLGGSVLTDVSTGLEPGPVVHNPAHMGDTNFKWRMLSTTWGIKTHTQTRVRLVSTRREILTNGLSATPDTPKFCLQSTFYIPILEKQLFPDMKHREAGPAALIERWKLDCLRGYDQENSCWAPAELWTGCRLLVDRGLSARTPPNRPTTQPPSQEKPLINI